MICHHQRPLRSQISHNRSIQKIFYLYPTSISKMIEMKSKKNSPSKPSSSSTFKSQPDAKSNKITILKNVKYALIQIHKNVKKVKIQIHKIVTKQGIQIHKKVKKKIQVHHQTSLRLQIYHNQAIRKGMNPETRNKFC